MATHSSTLTWKIPRTEEPGRLQSMGSLRVGQDSAMSLILPTFMHWRRKWQPTPVFLPGESQGRASLVGCLLGVIKSWTRLKRLSSSSSKTHQSWSMKSSPVSATSLVVQWLRLPFPKKKKKKKKDCHSQCRGVDFQFLVRELRSQKQQPPPPKKKLKTCYFLNKHI